MLIISIRTDKPEAEIGLFDNGRCIAHETWTAHRKLAETIHIKLKELLQSRQQDFPDIRGVVVFKGPGSFTGLRIGISVANALADGQDIPIVGTAGADWLTNGCEQLRRGKNDKIVLPEYGAAPRTTQPKR